MSYGIEEHYEYQYDSATAIDRDEAMQVGRFRRDRYWVLSDRDVWHQNPYYTGEPAGEILDLLPQPHPESWDYDEDGNRIYFPW